MLRFYFNCLTRTINTTDHGTTPTAHQAPSNVALFPDRASAISMDALMMMLTRPTSHGAKTNSTPPSSNLTRSSYPVATIDPIRADLQITARTTELLPRQPSSLRYG